MCQIFEIFRENAKLGNLICEYYISYCLTLTYFLTNLYYIIAVLSPTITIINHKKRKTKVTVRFSFRNRFESNRTDYQNKIFNTLTQLDFSIFDLLLLLPDRYSITIITITINYSTA